MTQARQCIKCSCPQESIQVLGVAVSRCPTCGGLWFEGGDIRRFNEQRKQHVGDVGLEQAIARLAKSKPVGAPPAAKSDAQVVGGTRCPACAGKMTTVAFAGTTIVQCNACDGLFLDKGELERAMTLLDSNEATTIMALAGSVSTSGSIG